MEKARYERTAMPRLRPSDTEIVASKVTQKTMTHCVFTLKSMPVLPCVHGSDTPHDVLRAGSLVLILPP